MSLYNPHLKGDGPLYEAMSRRKASPEARALMDAMLKDLAIEAQHIEQEDMIRAVVEIIYPQFPPFCLVHEAMETLIGLAARDPKGPAFQHMRQQVMLSGALMASRRGEDVAYLLDFLPRNDKNRGRKRRG